MSDKEKSIQCEDEKKSDCCTTETCDMFEFMSKYVGFKILHPGGLKATSDLLDILNITKGQRVLDIACGKGLTSIQIARTYGCEVIGVDIRPESVAEAKENAKKHGIEHLVSFHTMDATKMSFPDNQFDVTIAQAMLILVKDDALVMKEAHRLLKPSGRAGWIELCWREQPTEDFLKDASNAMCGACIGNVGTDAQWKKRFTDAIKLDVKSTTYPMVFRGMSGMVEDEGLLNGLKIMVKYMTNSSIRKRMQRLNSFFNRYPKYTGYGIFTFQK